jgi:tetratricopeptide (TPR) repeat protein
MRYAAFLSYSHADARWAQWLHRRLEAYRVPTRLVGTPGPDGPIGPRLGTIFRDREELPTSGDLGATIKTALSESSALIVVCSPSAARSRWAGREIELFRSFGRGDRIACFIVAGDPSSTGDDACFPAALLAPGPDGAPNEPLAADARPQGDGRDRAFLRLVAGLLGVSYDVLARREAQRRHRRMVAITAGALLGMAVAFGLAATAYVARNDALRRQAQAEDILGFMLGDLRTKLTTVGRLDLMRAVDDKATHYFATLNPRDLSDRSLEAQARSLTGIGQVRLDEAKYAEAMSAFREAYDRSSALVDRDPKNGQRLFDRAQAEYWVGLVYWRKAMFDDAAIWLTRYRDSALRLSAMDRSNFDWQKEVAYGQENLATLDMKRGRTRQAEAGFKKELELYRQWIRAHPGDKDLREAAANVASFLGSIAQADGRLAEAESHFQEQVDEEARNRAAEPDNAIWKSNWLNGQVHLANTQMARGHFDAARRSTDDATRLAEALAAQDPSNVDWKQITGLCHALQAKLMAPVDARRADQMASGAEAELRAAFRTQPDDERFLRSLADILLFRAELALSANAPAAALQLAQEAQTALAPHWATKPNDDLRLLLAEAQLRKGDAQRDLGDAAGATASWSASERLLRDGLGDPPAFNRLDLLVRVLQSQHRDKDAAPYLATLQRAGYVPLLGYAAAAGS